MILYTPISCKRLGALLRFLVRRAFEESGQGLKEYEIGLEVFGREPSYDPTIDPIVRVEVRRLRSRLSHYYEVEGLPDPVWISLPAGTYLPILRLRGTAASIAPRDKPAIAVLPFVDLTGGADGGSFEDGLTEDLITVLSGVDSVRVVCRTSSFEFKGKAHDVREAAKLLNAVAFVEGAVRHSGGRVRITVGLVNAISHCLVWSGSYDLEMGDALATQLQIARTIVRALRPHLAVDFRSVRTGPTKAA